MKILNTKRWTALRPLARKDIAEFKAVVDGWKLVPHTMLMSEAVFTSMLDLEREEDGDFLAWLDGPATKEGQE